MSNYVSRRHAYCSAVTFCKCLDTDYLRTRPQSYFDTSGLGFWTAEPSALCFAFKFLGFLGELVEIGQNTLKARAHCKYLKCESIFQSVYFKNRVARAVSKLHRPGIFPFLEQLLRPAWLWSLLVQGTSIANCDLVSPQPFFPVRSCTSWCYSTPWQSSPAGFLTQGPQASKVVQVQQMMLSWVRVLHYTSRGPPWHPIQAIITWKEWDKRDLPLKAF